MWDFRWSYHLSDRFIYWKRKFINLMKLKELQERPAYHLTKNSESHTVCDKRYIFPACIRVRLVHVTRTMSAELWSASSDFLAKSS